MGGRLFCFSLLLTGGVNCLPYSVVLAQSQPLAFSIMPRHACHANVHPCRLCLALSCIGGVTTCVLLILRNSAPGSTEPLPLAAECFPFGFGAQRNTNIFQPCSMLLPHHFPIMFFTPGVPILASSDVPVPSRHVG